MPNDPLPQATDVGAAWVRYRAAEVALEAARRERTEALLALMDARNARDAAAREAFNAG